MFERFTDHARHVLVLAQEEARTLNHAFVGTEHLLLGLLRHGDRVAAHALESLGVSLAAVREQVGEIGGLPSGSPGGGEAPFTPWAKKVLELSLREARQLGDEQIGPEHLLLGIVREGEGVAVQVLVNLGADPSRVRARVLGRISGQENLDPTGLPGVAGPSVKAGLRPRGMRDLPPPGRCSVCGLDLWETAHFAVGGHGRVCEECIRAASRMLTAVAEHRELVLPPRVPPSQPPDDEALQAIVTTIEGTFGPTAGPATWATTVEDPERFEPLLQRLEERQGRPESVQVTEVGLVTPQLAYARCQLRFDGSRGTDVSGQLRRHEGRWVITAETLTAVLRRRGVYVPLPPASQ